MEAPGNQHVTTVERRCGPLNLRHTVTWLDRLVNSERQIGAFVW
jgi:hypothetical protein